MSLYIPLAATDTKSLPTINSYQSIVLLFFAHKIVLHIRHVCLPSNNSKLLIIYINYFFFSTKSQNSKTYPRMYSPQVHLNCDHNHRHTTDISHLWPVARIRDSQKITNIRWQQLHRCWREETVQAQRGVEVAGYSFFNFGIRLEVCGHCHARPL